MNKNLKIVVTSIICLVIVVLFLFPFYSKDSSTSRKSKEFIKAIQYIKDGKYVDAYNIVEDEDEKEIVQTIFLEIFTNQFTEYTNIIEKIKDETKHIDDYLLYPSLYSKDVKYQQNIDKIYAEDYSKLYNLKDKMPKDIMFEDTHKFYDMYYENIELADGAFKDYENNFVNNKDTFSNKLQNISTKLTEFSDEYDSVVGKHPSSSIPDEYIILLELDKDDED